MIQEDVRGDRKVQKGVVVSNKMTNTVVVRVSRSVAHAQYGKVVVRSSKCYAHNELEGLKEGDEVEVGLENGKVIIKPLIAIAEFKRELKGCVEISKINPLEVKRIWKA